MNNSFKCLAHESYTRYYISPFYGRPPVSEDPQNCGNHEVLDVVSPLGGDSGISSFNSFGQQDKMIEIKMN